MTKTMDDLCVNTIRTLAMDAVQRANSGHPGTPMALAPAVYCLWQRFLRFDPSHPIWPNRDRFVLSAGHASMLMYPMLHLTGVRAVNPKYETLGQPSVTLEDIKRFRQLDSKCPGHPEYRWPSGVETTTGPLGQGVATSVGMAIAERWLASYFNRPGFELFDYDVYALCGDGRMMEGISGEAASPLSQAFPVERRAVAAATATRLVIVGGGFAGVYAAMYLDKTLARSRDVEVVLISRENVLVFTPMLHDVPKATNCNV